MKKGGIIKVNKGNTKRKKAQILRQLRKNKGLIATACKNSGVGRTTYYKWLKNDPEFAAAVADLDALEVEAVRSKLGDLIDGGNVQSTIFYLKHKDPMFKASMEITGRGGAPLAVAIKVFNPNEEGPVKDIEIEGED